MSHNLNAGRLRDYVEFYRKEPKTNEYGEVIEGSYPLAFDAWANCLVRSSSESYKFGSSVSETIVTMLMWNDERVNSDQLVRWDEKDYQVIGMPQVSSDKKSMVVTVKGIE